MNQQQLLTKVYFPRIYVPISAACVFLVDLVISLGLYAIVMCLLPGHTELDDRFLACASCC